TLAALGPAGFARMEVYARGEFAVGGRAAIGSIRRDGLCVEIGPSGPTYRGTAELYVPVSLDGHITATGTVGGALDWLCLFRALQVEGGLTGTGTAATQIEIVNTAVAVNCGDGHLDLDNSAELLAALRHPPPAVAAVPVAVARDPAGPERRPGHLREPGPSTDARGVHRLGRPR